MKDRPTLRFVLLRAVLGLIAGGLFACGGSDELGPTQISQQPQDQSVAVGAAAVFTVNFSGAPPVGLQWTKGGVEIPGANSTTYTTPPTIRTDDGLTFGLSYYADAGRGFQIPVYSRMARLSVTPAVPAGPGSFVDTGPMVLNRARHAAVLLPDGKVLIAGGTPTNAQSRPDTITSAELYDPATNTFAVTGSMNVARWYGHAAVLLPNGKVLVCGGTDFNSIFSSTTAEIFDPASGRFTPTGSMRVARSGHAAILLESGKVLVTGGSETNADASTAELYDPTTGSFTSTASLSQPRFKVQGASTMDGRALVVGGPPTGDVYSSATSVFVPSGAPAFVGRWVGMSAAALANGRILVVGGHVGPYTNAEPALLAPGQLYDPTANAFTQTGEMTWPRAYATATTLKDGRILVFGGEGNARWPDRAETFDPSTGTFSAVVSTGTGRIDHTATLLQDGRVLIAGGKASTAFIPSAAATGSLLFVP